MGSLFNYKEYKEIGIDDVFQVVSSLKEDNAVLAEEVSKTIQQSFNTIYDKVEESIATKGIEAKRDSYKLKLYEYVFEKIASERLTTTSEQMFNIYRTIHNFANVFDRDSSNTDRQYQNTLKQIDNILLKSKGHE